MAADSFDFPAALAKALADPQIAGNFKSALGGLRGKRLALFADPAELARLRATGKALKGRTLSRLPELLVQLEANCTRNGIRVHWAETTEEANRIVLSILRAHGADTVVKGKSMVSEEMGLNHFLEEHGVTPVETDLGEFIIQLAHQPPSHITAPALHMNRKQVAELFSKCIPDTPYTEDVLELNAIARRVLREKFRTAKAGLSGVNFAVAETGSLVLVENEGNGRMSTHCPDVHIALMGLEKVVEKLEHLPPLMRLLTGSATGQLLSTYVNVVSGPRGPHELDGPREVHLVILDNGRSNMFQDAELSGSLRCIRCGACLNNCPVYSRLGGHAYGSVYPGPIGSVITPQMEGLDAKGDLSFASSLCGACEEVCPVMIPLARHLRRIRSECEAAPGQGLVRGRGAKRCAVKTLGWRLWAFVERRPWLRERLLALAARLTGRWTPAVGPLAAWSQARTLPKLARKSLRQRVREEGVRHG
ncbi:Lactate utilization protein B [Fundidesulfovibrio magnetotacticus]|uniref:Lactate utilization protein B n=1 Tax=Fundidesulfovibrio magnetotacticus TaxID=2730080 RepID=A0A6V8LPF0_9BACT|nr:LutB/LldF family L-lactate oxidation iron-sulfur protein [Fundidesulfovibrio magnetotacticus]GFK92870.1 Lactate utilization protein B [Fundidesulfovibrio magnetotacticus]